MGKDEQHGLQQLVELIQSLDRNLTQTNLGGMEDTWRMEFREKPKWSYCGALKKVQDEGHGTAVDADEEVDT